MAVLIRIDKMNENDETVNVRFAEQIDFGVIYIGYLTFNKKTKEYFVDKHNTNSFFIQYNDTALRVAIKLISVLREYNRIPESFDYQA